ncbi:MAG: hypothetical protein CM15mP87_08880 [Candidatus Neomarinimicrobiota bacterium]|nr:MAG: hypothetical protein CM15mP87_08880 [Candidatus Neomarinimicrobiota bacterium]
MGEYFLEDELGYFLNISGENDSINFEYYINRFVNIEGDSIACTECVSIDVTSIDIAYDCQQPINCFSNPCSTSNCYSNQIAECIPNYCGSCWSDYFLDDNLIQCGVPEGCIDLSSVDFGDCDMALGIDGQIIIVNIYQDVIGFRMVLIMLKLFSHQWTVVTKLVWCCIQ